MSSMPNLSSNQPSISPSAMHGLQVYQHLLNKLLSDAATEAAQRNLQASEYQLQRMQERLIFAFSYYEPKLKNMFSWLFDSREDTNFTYDLSESNKDYLAGFVAAIVNQPLETVRSYIDELNNDHELNDHIRLTAAQAGDMAIDINPRYGRRLGWYAFVRALKPKVVIETGVDKGLGACVLTSALLKNASEGHLGFYYGTDINPQAGYLFQGKYKQVGTVLYGDSIESLKKLDVNIDIFINDSDHSAAYEAREYEVIKDKLSTTGLILADNAHSTDCLARFSKNNSKHFLFFQEKPEKHWYPGAGIGVSYSQHGNTFINQTFATPLITTKKENLAVNNKEDPLLGAIKLTT